MQIGSNYTYNYYKNPSFMSLKKADEAKSDVYVKPTKDEIITAKTKKAISECKYVVLGLGILYFAMKRNIKVNKIKAAERKLAELAKQKVLTPQLMSVNIDELGIIGV